jgi:hypothetical protein
VANQFVAKMLNDEGLMDTLYHNGHFIKRVNLADKLQSCGLLWLI